jgi:uncharacterized protein YcaQ
MVAYCLTKRAARRIAVHAQLLDMPRPTDLVAVVDPSSTATGSSASSTPPPDRKAGTLVVNAIHEDVRFSKAMKAAVGKEIEDLAAWLGLEVAGVQQAVLEIDGTISIVPVSSDTIRAKRRNKTRRVS